MHVCDSWVPGSLLAVCPSVCGGPDLHENAPVSLYPEHLLYGGACVQSERQREDAWWAGVVVIGGVFGVLSSCLSASPPPLPLIWLSREG